MLILTRRVGEKVSIGDDVVVTVLAVKGNQIRLGIDAPRETLIVREELYEKQARAGKREGRERLSLASDLRARA